MAYPTFSPARRSRRRRWIIALLIAVPLVALLIFTIQYRTEARVVAAYLAVTEEAVEMQAEAAMDLDSTLGTLSGIDRQDLFRRIEQMQAATIEASAAIDTVDVPSSAAEAHGYLVVATRSWEEALGMLDEAVIAVIDDSDPSAGQNLADALVLLRVGDVAFAEFLTRVDEFDTGIAEGNFESVAFVPAEGSVRFDPLTIETLLATIYRLGSQHNISITAVTDPQPVGERNSVPIVPDSESFVVQAVVANEGNEIEEQVSVTLRLIAADGSGPPMRVTQTVATLEPGEAKTCIFDGIELIGGSLYELVINATASGDEAPDDNAWRMVFYRNERV